jgi:hypothetical protein
LGAGPLFPDTDADTDTNAGSDTHPIPETSTTCQLFTLAQPKIHPTSPQNVTSSGTGMQ